jgi:hypothetical protein
VQRPTQSLLGHPLVRGDLQDFLEQGQRPGRVRVAVILGRLGEEGLQQVLLVLIQRRVTPPAGLVLERGGIVVLGVGPDPGVDRLPADAEHAGDVGGGATMIELQDSQGLAEQAGIPGMCELTSQASPLPGSQVELAHGFLLPH